MLTMGGAGIFGLSFEAVYGTYVAPTKWIPIRSESVTHTEDKQILRPIRGLAVASKVKRGYTVEEGDIEFEVTSTNLLYMLYASRVAITKSAGPPYTYNFVPVSVVQPTTGAGAAVRKSLTIQIERGGEVFAYTGCTVTSLSFTIDSGDLICTAHVMGLALDTAQAAVSPTFPAWNPFGPGTIGIELPVGGGARIDIDTFSIEINDGGEALNRIKQGSRGPSYIRWGEREVSGSFEHDFSDLTEYDAFNDNTSRDMAVTATNDALSDQVEITLRSLITNTYPINLGDIGGLVRATVDFRSVYNGSPEYEIEIKSTVSIT